MNMKKFRVLFFDNFKNLEFSNYLPSKNISYWVISKYDPALDIEESNYVEYLKSFFDEKYLVFKTNEKPTRFKIQQLTSNQFDYLIKKIDWI